MDLPNLKETLTLRRLLLFGYVWLMVGFASGTLVLLGPAAWVTRFVAGAGGGEGARNAAMIALIVLYVLVSFILALWLTRFLLSYRARGLKAATVAAITAAAGLALWGWGNPARFGAFTGGGDGEQILATASGARFIFGAYPDREKLAALKAEGVTAVVSLQHPAVVPIEPQGIAAEKEATADMGIEFIHAPMLPWISDNEASLEKIRDLVRQGTGTYYVHCGLGRDRVGVARRAIEAMPGGVRTAGATEDALTWGDREAAGLGELERGAPVELAPDVWLVPYPNQYEMFGHMFAGQVAHAVLMLDAGDETQAAWLEEAERQFELYDLPWSTVPVESDGSVRALLSAADTLPRPLTVIVGHTAPRADSLLASRVIRAWAAR